MKDSRQPTLDINPRLAQVLAHANRLSVLGLGLGFATLFTWAQAKADNTEDGPAPTSSATESRLEWDQEASAKIGFGRLAADGKIYAMPYNARDVGNGTLIYDGQKWSQGSRSVVGYSDWMWHIGNDFWCTSAAVNIATCGVYSATGPFQSGERIDQMGSGAYGAYLRTENETNVLIAVRDGRFQAETTPGGAMLYGNESGNTAETGSCLVSNPQLILNRSADPSDPSTNWFPVMNFRGQNFKCQLIDCGMVNNKHLLLWPESRQAGGDTAIFYNYPEDGNDWIKLMDINTNAITHFHGGVYIGHKLYLFTGDTDTNAGAGILFCPDITNLLAAPLQWQANWGLNLGGSNRKYYMLNGLGTNYAVGIGQKFRTLDLIPDATGRYAYWISDREDVANVVHRLDLTTHTVESGTATVLGPGAFGTRLSNGTILYGTMSEFHKGKGGWWNGDEYAHVYQLNGLVPLEFYRGRRYTDTMGLAYFQSLFEWTPANGSPRVIISSCRQNAVVEGGTTVWQIESRHANSKLVPSSLYPKQLPASLVPDNWLEDPQIMASSFTTNYARLERDTTVWDPQNSVQASLKITPLSGGTPTVSLRFPTATMAPLKGGFVTVRFRFLQTTNQGAAFYFTSYANKAMTIRNQESIGLNEASTNWLTAEMACFVPMNAQFSDLTIVTSRANETNPLYISGLEVVPGNFVGRLHLPTVNCAPGFSAVTWNLPTNQDPAGQTVFFGPANSTNRVYISTRPSASMALLYGLPTTNGDYSLWLSRTNAHGQTTSISKIATWRPW